MQIRRGDEQKRIEKQKTVTQNFKKHMENLQESERIFAVVESQQALNQGAQAWCSLLAFASFSLSKQGILPHTQTSHREFSCVGSIRRLLGEASPNTPSKTFRTFVLDIVRQMM